MISWLLLNLFKHISKAPLDARIISILFHSIKTENDLCTFKYNVHQWDGIIIESVFETASIIELDIEIGSSNEIDAEKCQE